MRGLWASVYPVCGDGRRAGCHADWRSNGGIRGFSQPKACPVRDCHRPRQTDLPRKARPPQCDVRCLKPRKQASHFEKIKRALAAAGAEPRMWST